MIPRTRKNKGEENCLNSGVSLGSGGGISLAIGASTALGVRLFVDWFGWLGFRVLFFAISLVLFLFHTSIPILITPFTST